MVDPIGIVGTLMGIVQVCGKFMSVCYDYRMGVRDAPKDISRILDEVVGVGSIAQQLVKVIESDGAPSLPSLQAMGGNDGTLRRCLVELQDLKASLKLGRASSSRRALAWPLPRADVEKRLQVLATIKSTLQLALAADNTQNMMEVSNLARLLPSVEKKITKLSGSVAQSDEDLLAELLNQLGGRSQSAKQKQEYRKCAPATGDWLLNTAQYMKWKTNPNNLLWIKGAAGCGKTVLCSRIIKDLQDHCGGEQMKALLDKDASPNVTGGLFYRPLQAAACMGHREIVHLLIEATAEINAKGGALSTALGAAAAQGHLDVAVTLLEAGANVNIPDPWRFGGQ
ncbi:hypothetical protein AnigIFM63604_006362, partial [Aspergillus niger]